MTSLWGGILHIGAIGIDLLIRKTYCYIRCIVITKTYICTRLMGYFGDHTCQPDLSHIMLALLWRHNGRDGVSNHQPHDCLLNHSFRRRSKKTWKLRVTGLCAGNSSVTGEFPAQMASNAENASIWWRHHELMVRWDSCNATYTSPPHIATLKTKDHLFDNLVVTDRIIMCHNDSL